MPRNSGGTYSLPAGNPVVTGEVISSAWANTTMTDLGTALTASLDRSGQGGMLAPLALVAGAIGTPSLTWTLETTAGIYRAGAGDFRWAIAGVDVLSVTSAGITARALIPSASTVPTNGIYLPDPNTLAFATNSTARGSINNVGNWSISAPSSGTTFTINGAAATTTRGLHFDGTTTAAHYGQFSNTGCQLIFGVDNSGGGGLINGSSAYSGCIGTVGATPLAIGTNNTERVRVSAAGNVTINAPSSGTAFGVTAIAGQFGVSVSDGTVLGGFVTTGTPAFTVFVNSNHHLDFYTNAVYRARIGASGGMEIGSPAGGNKGSGTLNTAGQIYINDVPVGSLAISRTISASSDTAASDTGLVVVFSGGGGQTFQGDSDVPTNGIVTVVNIGAVMDITATGTLTWLSGAATATGTRNLSPGGICYLWSRGSGNYYVWGIGLS